MKKAWKLVLCLALAVAMLSCMALAADAPEVAVATGMASDGVAVDGDGNVTVKVPAAMVKEGNQYVIFLVKVDAGDKTVQQMLTASYDLGPDTILYIDQAAAESTGLTFTGKPKSMASCVVVLGGTSADGTAIDARVIGAIKTKGVSVKGQVKSYNAKNATTITLTDASGAAYSATIPAESATAAAAVTQSFEVPGVPAGTYTLKVTKPGHLSYTVTGVVVGDAEVDLTTSTKAYRLMTLLCADIDGNDLSNNSDLRVFRGDFGKSDSAASSLLTDCNGDGKRNNSDLLAFRAGFGKTAPKVTY